MEFRIVYLGIWTWVGFVENKHYRSTYTTNEFQWISEWMQFEFYSVEYNKYAEKNIVKNIKFKDSVGGGEKFASLTRFALFTHSSRTSECKSKYYLYCTFLLWKAFRFFATKNHWHFPILSFLVDIGKSDTIWTVQGWIWNLVQRPRHRLGCCITNSNSYFMK